LRLLAEKLARLDFFVKEKRTAVLLSAQVGNDCNASDARAARPRGIEATEDRNPHPRLPAMAGEGADLASKVTEEANQDDEGNRNAQQQQEN
jgi:hypothetical protein